MDICDWPLRRRERLRIREKVFDWEERSVCMREKVLSVLTDCARVNSWKRLGRKNAFSAKKSSISMMFGTLKYLKVIEKGKSFGGDPDPHSLWAKEPPVF